MVRVLVMQPRYHLSGGRIELQLRDRPSAQRFVALRQSSQAHVRRPARARAVEHGGCERADFRRGEPPARPSRLPRAPDEQARDASNTDQGDVDGEREPCRPKAD